MLRHAVRKIQHVWNKAIITAKMANDRLTSKAVSEMRANMVSWYPAHDPWLQSYGSVGRNH